MHRSAVQGTGTVKYGNIRHVSHTREERREIVPTASVRPDEIK